MMRGFSVMLLGFSCALQLCLVGSVHEQTEASIGTSSSAAMSGDIGEGNWKKFKAIIDENGKRQKMESTSEGQKALRIWEELFTNKEVEGAIDQSKLLEAFESLSKKETKVEDYLNDPTFQKLDSVMTAVLKGSGELEALRVGSTVTSGTSTSKNNNITEEGAHQIADHSQVQDAASSAEVFPKQKKITLTGFPQKGEKDITNGTERHMFNGDYYQYKDGRCVAGKPTYWKHDGQYNLVMYWCPMNDRWGVTDQATYDRFTVDINNQIETNEIHWGAHVWFQKDADLQAGLTVSRVRVGGCEGCETPARDVKDDVLDDSPDAWVKNAKVETIEDTNQTVNECSKE